MMITQSLLDAHEEKLLSFQEYVTKLRKKHEYLLEQTENADQTLMFFGMLESITDDCLRTMNYGSQETMLHLNDRYHQILLGRSNQGE
jgi:hypothetical protein